MKDIQVRLPTGSLLMTISHLSTCPHVALEKEVIGIIGGTFSVEWCPPRGRGFRAMDIVDALNSKEQSYNLEKASQPTRKRYGQPNM